MCDRCETDEHCRSVIRVNISHGDTRVHKILLVTKKYYVIYNMYHYADFSTLTSSKLKEAMSLLEAVLSNPILLCPFLQMHYTIMLCFE